MKTFDWGDPLREEIKNTCIELFAVICACLQMQMLMLMGQLHTCYGPLATFLKFA